MAADSTPPGLSVRLPYATAEEFLRRYGANLTRGGLFLRSSALRPPGTTVTLEVKLESGERLLYATAVVAWVSGNRGEGICGMAFKFIALDEPSRRFLEAAAAAMPHVRSEIPPVLPHIGPIDTRPDAVMASPLPTPLSLPPSQSQPLLPSEEAGQLLVQGEVSVRAPAFAPAPEPPRTGVIIGIDLGTTNSCAAAVIDGKPQILHLEGERLIPSMVALSPRGTLLVGAAARAQLATYPKWVAYGFKRFLGRQANDPEVSALSRRFPYDIRTTETGGCAVQLGDRCYTLEQLAALVLAQVKALAQRRLRTPVHRAVITVPSWYGERQREAVREAGRLAGFHVERIVNEPTAAALAWGHVHRKPQRVLVYDLGGGTFDASVLELKDDVYAVVSTGGNAFLGGIDFDSAIVAWLLAEFEAHTDTIFTDRVTIGRVRDAAERAKMLLSEKTEAPIRVPFVASVDGRSVDLDVTLKRGQLEKLTRNLVDATMDVCQEILKARGLRVDEIDEIVLVGGQSRAPLVRDRIALLFGRVPVTVGNPEEAVALGAALLAHALDTKRGLLLIDVPPKSIGVGLTGGKK